MQNRKISKTLVAVVLGMGFIWSGSAMAAQDNTSQSQATTNAMPMNMPMSQNSGHSMQNGQNMQNMPNMGNMKMNSANS